MPSSSTHVFQFLLVTHSMLRKDPEQRPTVQQLLALPSLQHAVAEARRLARAMKPDVYLPPMAQASAAVCLCKCVCVGCVGWVCGRQCFSWIKLWLRGSASHALKNCLKQTCTPW